MASATAGVKTRVAVKIASEEPRAIYTHYYGQALNVAWADTNKTMWNAEGCNPYNYRNNYASERFPQM